MFIFFKVVPGRRWVDNVQQHLVVDVIGELFVTFTTSDSLLTKTTVLIMRARLYHTCRLLKTGVASKCQNLERPQMTMRSLYGKAYNIESIATWVSNAE